MTLIGDVVAANTALQSDPKVALGTKKFAQSVTVWVQSFSPPPTPPATSPYSGIPLLIRSF